MGQQILLDTTVVIAALRDTDKHFTQARELFSTSGRMQLAISSITLTEALIRPHSLGLIQANRVESKIHELIGTVHSYDERVASLAAKIRATQKARISDSMIIATAIVYNNKLVTFDRKMMGIYERIK